MSKTPTQTIAITLGGARGAVTEVAATVRRSLTRDGWKVVRASRLKQLETVLNEIYVDNRRQRQVDLLDEARKIVTSL